MQCFWRRIPIDSGDSKDDQELYKQREEAALPIWPRMEMEMEMEMDELKLALESGC